MNKIYQVLWSKTRRMYVVVSEIATRNAKAPGTKTLLGARLAAAALVLAVGIGQGLAYAEDKTVDIGNGGTATYTEKGNVVIGKDNTVPNDGAGKNVVTGTGNSAQHVDGTGNAQKFLPDDPKLVDDNNGNPSPVETPGNTKGLDSAVISGNGASAEADGDTSIGKGANITNPLVPYYADENGNATSDPNAAAYFYQNGKLVKGTDGLKYATGATDADGNPVVTDDPYYKHTYETTVTILHPDGTIERKKVEDKIQEIRSQHKDYGYRRMTGELKNQGLCVNKKKVQRIMQELSLQVTSFTRKSRKYSSYKGKVGTIAPNRIHRRFETNIPHQKITTDTSEFKYYEVDPQGHLTLHKLYLDPFLDMFNDEIISYGIAKRPSAESILEAQAEAIEITADCPYRRTFHSDQGWAYQMKAYARNLKKGRIFQSMSRKGNCHDNAVMENFFGLMKQEMYYGVIYYSYEELKNAIERYIKYYNEQRIKEKLCWKSPVQYRLSLQAA